MEYNKENCFYLGRIIRASGLKGDLLAVFDVDNPDDYAGLDSVFVMNRGTLVPQFIEKIEIRTNGVMLHFEETDYDKAQDFIGRELYLPLDVLPPLTGNKFYFHEVVGFEVRDAELGSLGRLREVIDNGPQPVACIDHPDGKEILLPLIDEFLQTVDRENRRLNVKAPEGLVAFYLDL